MGYAQRKTDMTEVNVVKHAESDVAIYVSANGNEDEAVRLEKSCIERCEARMHSDRHTVTLPMAVAQELKLV